MNKRLSISIIFLLTAVFGPASPAREPGNPALIQDLVERTLADNPEIKFYEAEITMAKAGRRVAGKLSNPELDLEIGGKRSVGREFSAEGVAFAVGLFQPIEWPGRIGLRKSIANGDVQLAEHGLAQFKTVLAGRVRVLAYLLSTEQERATSIAEVSERLSAVKDVLVQREAGGINPLLEIRAIDAASISMEKDALEAAVSTQKILLKLNQLMGRRADFPLVVARVDFQFPEYSQLEELYSQALENNYRMLIRKTELEQQGFRVSLAENERFPTIKLGPYFSREEAGEQETEAGIGISLELPIFRNGRAEVDQAQARRMQAQAMLYKTARELELEVAEAVLVYQNYRKRLLTWSTERVESFRKAAELADRHYRLGAVPVATYIELQRSYLEAQEAITHSRAEALEAALDLEQLVGANKSVIAPFSVVVPETVPE